MASSRLASLSCRSVGIALATCVGTYCYDLDSRRKDLRESSFWRSRSVALCDADDRPPTENSNHPLKQTATPDESIDNSYPNFSRHGSKSLLKQYLTPSVYQALKDKKTANGVTLEDCIQAGVLLPWGADPPRGLAGVFVGDAESYKTFSDLLLPLIEQHHKPVWRPKLQRHRTDMSPKELVQQKLDPTGQYVLFTRMRLARSIEGFPFAPSISREQRRTLERLIRDCVSGWKQGHYLSVMDMSNDQHEDLVERQILFPDPDAFDIAAGLARDWPDSRGIYCDNWTTLSSVSIWVNAEDHIWMISTAKGGDVQGVFTKLSESMMALETSLADRGYTFVQDRRLGFLNTSPSNIGTALRASVSVKLVRLGQLPGFAELVKRLRLEASAEYEGTDKQRYTGIFSIANGEALGKSELQLANIMIRGVGQLIELEKRLETGEELDLDNVAHTVLTTNDTAQP